MQQIQGLENFVAGIETTQMSDLKVGETGKCTFLVTMLETKQDKNGSNYCNIDMCDGTDTYNAKMWKTTAEDCGFSEGDVIDAIMKASDYNGRISYTVTSAAINENEDPADFIVGAPISVSDMFAWMEGKVAAMREPIRSIVEKLAIENKDAYCFSSAARSNHHAYIGGLLYHSYRMARSAELLCTVYNADPDLSVAGCIIHDIGKLKELTTNAIGQTDYTIDGQLESHIQIGIRMLDEAAREIGVPIDDEDVKMLRHIISSHHGRIEFGSASLPATSEAILVSNLDNLDMRETVWEAETKQLEPGTCTLGMNQVLQTKPYLRASR